MLSTVVEAGLPLVAVRTRDTINLPEVIKELTGKAPHLWSPTAQSIGGGQLYYFPCPKGAKGLTFGGLYEKLVKKESTLLVVNPPVVEDEMFDAGEVPVPKTLMHQFMATVTDDAKKAQELLRALGGVTIKEAAELARLTMARDKGLTAHGVMATRKQFFAGQSGLSLVDPAQPLYVPDYRLAEYAERERPFFLSEGTDPRLVPRGLLLDGPPGTGKTSGAKFLAESWGVPLYRVDIGGTKTKWLGESEANMLANLTRLDREEPCIALVDEVEKVFSVDQHGGDAGTTTTMMSQLLWWLAEHKSRVLTMMTTNAAKKLPKELYREGRIDEVMVFGGLEKGAARKFAGQVLATFPSVKWDDEHTDVIVAEAMEKSKIDTNPPTVSQAAVTKATYEHVKGLGKAVGK